MTFVQVELIGITIGSQVRLSERIQECLWLAGLKALNPDSDLKDVE